LFPLAVIDRFPLQLKKVATERSAELRKDYLLAIGTEPEDRFVFCDETSVNALTANRVYGWSHRGERAVVAMPFVRGRRLSVLPALCVNGIICAHIIEGSFDGDSFCQFLRDLVRNMNPYPGPQSILVLDNCSIHHVAEVEEIVDEAGVRLQYLSPYSPDYNPIEECFSWMKSHIRKHREEYQYLISLEDDIPARHFLYNMLTEVTPALAHSWLKSSGYAM